MLINNNWKFLVTRTVCIVITVVFCFFAGHSRLFVTNIPLDSLTRPRNISLPNPLSLYHQQLSLLNHTAFLPTFHNHRLAFTFNLTSLAVEQRDYLQREPSMNITRLTLTLLPNASTGNPSHSLGDIHFAFHLERSPLNQGIHLTYSSHNSTGSLSLLPRHADVLTVNIHRTFSSEVRFRFVSRWSHRQETQTLSWPHWPPTSTCLHSSSNSSACSSHRETLPHSSSHQLFLAEQNALSNWLDLQYSVFVAQILPSQGFHSSLERRNRIPFERANNPLVCSKQFQDWISQYQQWHKNVTFLLLHSNNSSTLTLKERRDHLIDLDVRFLVYEKHVSGIADRVTHLISTYLVALLTKRLFVFDKFWPEFTETMQPSLNYEQDLLIPWLPQIDLLNGNLSRTDRQYLSTKTQWFSFDRFLQDYNYDKAFPERILIFKGHTGGVTHTIHSNSSIYRKFLTEDLRMNASNLFGCLYHSLFTPKLSELIKTVAINSHKDPLGHSSEEILRSLLSPRLFPVGVQIRSGDEHMRETTPSRNSSNSEETLAFNRTQHFFQCAQQIVTADIQHLNKSNQMPILFLLSDSYRLRRAALKRWPFSLPCVHSLHQECQWQSNRLHILSSSTPVLHIQYAADRTLAFRLGMFDMFLFSLCEQHLVSIESGFGRIAAFASLKLRNIYSLPRDERKACPKEGIPLALAGYHWSAI